ncbi:hypothetical protein ACS0TY_018151 [Phlomoides rotata]
MKDDDDECNMDVFDNGIQIILKEIGQDLSGFKCGLVHFFLQHTSASLTVNENYDSDVRDISKQSCSRVYGLKEGLHHGSILWKTLVLWSSFVSGFSSCFRRFCVEGLSNRRTNATRVNAESSRSHRVFTCVVKSRSKS